MKQKPKQNLKQKPCAYIVKKLEEKPIYWFELKRQSFHILLGPVLILLLEANILDEFRILFLVVFGLILSFISLYIKIPVVSWFLKHFERPEDMKWFPGKGKLFYFLGVLMSLVLFDRDIAYASIIVLAFGDSLSHVISRHYGEIKHPLNQSRILEGWLIGVIAGWLGAAFFIPIWYAFWASLIAMSIEVLELESMHKIADDNLAVPLAAGTIVHILRYFA